MIIGAGAAHGRRPARTVLSGACLLLALTAGSLHAAAVTYVVTFEAQFGHSGGTGTIVADVTGDPATSSVLAVQATVDGITFAGDYYVNPAQLEFSATDLTGFSFFVSSGDPGSQSQVGLAEISFPALSLSTDFNTYAVFQNFSESDQFAPFTFAPDTTPVEKLFFIDRASALRIGKANLDGSDVEDVVSSGLSLPSDVAVNRDRSKVYWSDVGLGSISRADYDGGNQETLVTGLAFAGGIALDTEGGWLYYTDSGSNPPNPAPDRILRARLDGSAPETLLDFGASVSRGVVRIALDVPGGKMYWTDSSGSLIQRANLDGSAIETLVTDADVVSPLPLRLDLVNGKMYWGSTVTDSVARANLDGSNVEGLITGWGNIDGLALDVPRRTLYFSAGQQKKILKAGLDGDNPEILIDLGIGSGSSQLGGIDIDVIEPADTDNDGIPDDEEILAGTDPDNANSPRLPQSENPDPSILLVASVLPGSRAVGVGDTATAFATLINAGTRSALRCTIYPITSVNATFFFQATAPATNVLTGAPNHAVNLGPGQSGSFAIGFTPSAPFAATDVSLSFRCQDAADASIIAGVNTFTLAATAVPGPDMVALAGTLENDGIVHVPGGADLGFFVVGSSNVGSGADLTVSADTGAATLPVSLSLCETAPATGACTNPPVPTAGPVRAFVDAGATPTFAVFVGADEAIPLDPAAARVFVRFTDPAGKLVGSTSVAVEAP